MKVESVRQPLTAALQSIQDAMKAPASEVRRSEIEEETQFIARSLDLAFSDAEYQRWNSMDVKRVCSRWRQVLQHRFSEEGVPSQMLQHLAILESGLPIIKHFYRIARKRDAALVTNAIAKLKKSKAHVAVLITGGAHSAQVTQLLKARGVGVVVVAPSQSP